MDYKELIDKLREDSMYHKNNSNDAKAKYFEVIATAIETLLAERDTAVGMLRGECHACKHNVGWHNVGKCRTCIHETAAAIIPKCQCDDNWEWHGLQK